MAKEYVALLTYPCYSSVSIGCRGAEVDKMLVIITNTAPGVQRKSHRAQDYGKKDKIVPAVQDTCTISPEILNSE